MADRQLRELARALSAFDEAAFLVGTDRRIRAANSAARELLGRDVSGAPVHGVLRQPAALAVLEDAWNGGTVQQAEISLFSAGRDHRIRLRIVPLGQGTEADAADRAPDLRPDHRGRAAGAVVSMKDLSDADEAEEIRASFVANVSHELRSPLATLIGLIETLQGPASDDPAAAARFLAMMDSETARMKRLIDDLLSLSRVEAEERQRPQERLDLVPVIREAVEGLSFAAEDAGLRVELDCAQAQAVVLGDRDQLRQVMTNIIENALKYGGQGGAVRILVCEEAGAHGREIHVETRDNGPGIAAEHLPRLTERFYRVDSHRSRALGGTGLGLAIVKHIVSRHRGRLRIRSTPGKGTSVSVWIPAA